MSGCRKGVHRGVLLLGIVRSLAPVHVGNVCSGYTTWLARAEQEIQARKRICEDHSRLARAAKKAVEAAQ